MVHNPWIFWDTLSQYELLVLIPEPMASVLSTQRLKEQPLQLIVTAEFQARVVDLQGN